jgi:hypothetical protein
MTPILEPVKAADAIHRANFRRFVVAHAEAWHREHLGTLYDQWEIWNGAFFEGKMVAPYIMFGVPSCPRTLGDYAEVSGFGGHSQIRIRQSLLTGKHPSVRSGEAFAEGRSRLVSDVLLHETIHQYQHELLRRPENSYKGHGPLFRDKCNEIGSKLDLPLVRVAKARGQDKTLQSCAHWPHAVRPDGYYLGAFENTPDEAGLRGQTSNAQRQEEDLTNLVVAAQAFGRRWPEGSEAEAASWFAGGRLRGEPILRTLATLCRSAQEFNRALDDITSESGPLV